MQKINANITDEQYAVFARVSAETGRPIAELLRNAIDKGLMEQPAKKTSVGYNYIGLTERELDQYNLNNVIDLALYEARITSEPSILERAKFERECSAAAKLKSGVSSRGITIPLDVLSTRTLNVGTAASGGNTVATQLLGVSFIDVLRSRSVVIDLGATMLHGLSGDAAIPRKTSGSTAGWITTEGGDAAESSPAFDQVTLSPKHIGVYSDVTRQLLLQSSLDVKSLLMSDHAAAIATALDVAALYGTGISGQPKGISNQTGISNPSDFAASVPTWAEIVGMETVFGTDNNNHNNAAYVLHPSMKGGLAIKPKFDSAAVEFVYEHPGVMNTYPVAITTNCNAGDIFFGNWSELLIGTWGGLDILIDPYTHSKSGSIRIVSSLCADVAVRHPEAFVYQSTP